MPGQQVMSPHAMVMSPTGPVVVPYALPPGQQLAFGPDGVPIGIVVHPSVYGARGPPPGAVMLPQSPGMFAGSPTAAPVMIPFAVAPQHQMPPPQSGGV